jgi:hypothetical protein
VAGFRLVVLLKSVNDVYFWVYFSLFFQWLSPLDNGISIRMLEASYNLFPPAGCGNHSSIPLRNKWQKEDWMFR